MYLTNEEELSLKVKTNKMSLTNEQELFTNKMCLTNEQELFTEGKHT